MKTAIQELIDELDNKIKSIENNEDVYFNYGIRKSIQIAFELLEKEKEQIKDAWDAGMSEGIGTMMADLDWDGEFVNYYKETYGE